MHHYCSSIIFIFILTLMQIMNMNAPAEGKALGLKAFQKYAKQGVGRCTTAIKVKKCQHLLTTALKQKLISKTSYNWGKKTGHYPVFIGKEFFAVCKCGCLAKGTIIHTLSGETPIEEVTLNHQAKFLTDIAENQTMNYAFKKPKKTIFDPEPKSQLLQIYLQDNENLIVTGNHGMLTSDGKMHYANELQKGDHLLHHDGHAVKVEKIETLKDAIPVYNIEIDSKQYNHRFIIANNIIVGDLSWQNQNEYLMHQVNIRYNQR